MWRSPSSPQIHQKYIYTWNCSYRTPTERWQKTSDIPKGKKLPMYLGRAKGKRKNRDKRIGMGPAPQGRSCEGGKVSTRKPLHWGGLGEASEPWRRAQQQGCRGQSGEIPTLRISAGQHSPAREACLLTGWGGRGSGAEARASEVGSQGKDWGWWREHSLKGASAPQLAGSPGKSLELPNRQETIVSGCVRIGDSEHRLNELQRWA